MVDPLNLIGSGQIESLQPKTGKVSTDTLRDGASFKDMLLKSINEVNQLQMQADEAQQKLASGQTDNVAEVFSASRKADVAYSMLMQIRNHLIDAYTEVRQMRM